MPGTVIYEAKSKEEFQELLLWMQEQGFNSPPILTAAALRGPKETEYIDAVGQTRMRLTDLEVQSGLSREEVANARLKELAESGTGHVDFSK